MKEGDAMFFCGVMFFAAIALLYLFVSLLEINTSLQHEYNVHNAACLKQGKMQHICDAEWRARQHDNSG